MRVDPKAAPVARRVHKRGQRKKVHYFAPGRIGHLSQLESRLEVGGAAVMGLDPRVMGMRSQPMCFDLTTGRTSASKEQLREATSNHLTRPIEYTPDFEVLLAKGPVLVEVKHSELIAKCPKILQYPSILARYGHRLVILDEKLLTETLVRNMRLLTIALKQPVSRELLDTLVGDCANGRTFSDLVARGHPQRAILDGIARGILTTDLRSERLSEASRISVTSGLPNHLMELPLG